MVDVVRLDVKGKDGKSLRDHLDQVEKATGQRPPELESVEVPWQGEYVWRWFWELHGGRQAGMSGPMPLAWEAIRAWSELCHIELDSWELYTIKALDGKYLEQVGKKNDGLSQSSNRNRNPVSKGRRR